MLIVVGVVRGIPWYPVVSRGIPWYDIWEDKMEITFQLLAQTVIAALLITVAVICWMYGDEDIKTKDEEEEEEEARLVGDQRKWVSFESLSVGRFISLSVYQFVSLSVCQFTSTL